MAVVAVVVRPARRDDLQAVLDVHARHGSRPDAPASPLERDTWDRMTAEAEGFRLYLRGERPPR